MKKLYYLPKGILFTIILSIGLTFVSCGHYEEFDNSSYMTINEKTFNTEKGKTLKLKTSSGDVIITTSDEPEVYVKILGNERAEKKIKFDFDESNEGVTVIARGRDNWNLFNFGNHIKLRFEVRIPRDYNVKVSTSGGDLKLTDLNGKIDLNTSGGDIDIKNTSGSLIASTSGGEVSLNNTTGNVDLKTSGGDIKALGFDGDVSAYTSGGSIELRGSNGKIDANTSGGDVHLDYSGPNNGIHLETSGGDIKLLLPQDFNANARMYTSGGTIHCDFPGNNVTNISSGKYEADLNSGGKEVVAKTSGGDISVNKK